LNQVKSTLQTELNHFFQVLDQASLPLRQVTTAAFSKARQHLSHEAFIELNQKALSQFYTKAVIRRFKGLRVLAVDGSKVRLPNTPALSEAFGGQANQHCERYPMALASVLYDVFQQTVVDAQLFPYATSEREAAYQHLLQGTSEHDLVLFDRGYPAFWLMSAYHHAQRYWCMRVKEGFNHQIKAFVQSGSKEAIITLRPGQKAQAYCRERGVSDQPLTVRLIRVQVQKTTLILITNLLDQARYPRAEFKNLYRLRWQIEEGFKRQKSWLQIENFTGLSLVSIQQDFHARILTYNLTVLTMFASSKHYQGHPGSGQWHYHINFAQALSMMKDTLVLIFSHRFIDLHSLLNQISKALTPRRPGRSFARKLSSARGNKYPMQYKRCL
jgi:hypothetical protein